MRGIAIILLVLAAGPRLHGDWLVTRDGARIETLEHWEVRHGTVVFKTPTGTLSSMRLAEIDLEASDAATFEAKQPPPPPPPPVLARPVLVLTTKDVGRGQLVDQDAETDGEGGAPNSEEAPAVAISNVAVEVTSWEREDVIDIGGYRLTGYVRNNGGQPVHDLKLTISLYDSEAKPLANTVAQLGTTFLGVDDDKTTSFRAVFQDTPDFAGDPRFALSAEETPTVDRLELRVVDGRDAEELFRAGQTNERDGFDDPGSGFPTEEAPAADDNFEEDPSSEDGP